jgi:serine/threonine protein kinase/tetratricopeptide (TPR) repeat protein
MIGQTLGHYRILEKIGAGGMGEVYRAHDERLDRDVALKLLPPGTLSDEVARKHFRKEALMLSKLNHPNIATVYDFDSQVDVDFLAMEHVAGQTLTQVIAGRALLEKEVIKLGVQIAEALEEAHEHGVIHRDLKPGNVMVTAKGRVKVLDFGLARLLQARSEVVASTENLTEMRAVAGTLPYMAPEQLRGEPADARTDIYGAGALLYEMATGARPFPQRLPTSLVDHIFNRAPPPPGRLQPDLTPRLEATILKCLDKDPENRYQSAKEMLVDLRRTASGSGEADRQPVPPQRLAWKRVAVAAGFVGSILVALLVLVSAVALLFPRLRENLFGFAYARGEKHIAVLPFDCSGSDPDYQLVANGLMESMTNELSNLDAAQESLWVVPASVVRDHKVNDPTAAFRELGATMVVQGRIEQKGQALYLTVNLIDSKHLRQIGSAKFENPSGDLATLQNEAVFHLAGLMNVKGSSAALIPAGSVASSAYESYLKALGYMQRYDKPGNLDLAISALNSSVEKAPRFALGYTTLGEAYRLKFLTDHHPAWVEQAFANCRTAVEINDRLPAAHVTLGHLNATLGKNDLALQEFQRALEINPRDADALTGLAGVYEHMGDIADAEANYKRAITLRPDYWGGYNALGDFYGRRKRVQEAIEQYQRVIELTPDNTAGYNNLGIEYMELNNSQSDAAAEGAFQKSIQLAPNYQAYANLGWLYMNQKRFAEAAAATRKALELNDKDWRVWANLLVAYAWLKDDEKMRPVRAKTLSLLEQYASLNSEEAPVQSMLSTFYAEDKLREKALARVNAALALAPEDPWVLADIAETYNDLGDRKRAIRYAQESLKNGYTLTDLQRRPALLGLLADPSFRPSGKQ